MSLLFALPAETPECVKFARYQVPAEGIKTPEFPNFTLKPDAVFENCDPVNVPWRFQQSEARFSALVKAYRRLGWKRQYQALTDCGSNAYVERGSESGRLRIRCNKCHLSTCPECSRERQFNLAGNLRVAMKAAKHRIRFMTLTMRQSDRPLFKQITRIQSCFRLLRKQRFFKKAVKNLVWVLEIKLSKKGLWNVHFHALIEGFYIDRGQLSAAWHKITGDSPIVDIRATNERAPVELTKYISKQYDEFMFRPGNEDKLDEFMAATHRRRTIGVIGRQWRDLKLTSVWSDPPDSPEESWLWVGRLQDIMDMAKDGDKDCREMLKYLLPRWKG